MGKMLVGLGLVLVCLGGLVWLFEAGGRGIPRLPGDLVIEGDHGTFFFPIVSCLVISVVLSLLMRLLR